MSLSLAEVAAEYVREHRVERQCSSLSSDERVALTIIQNRWADRMGRDRQTIFTAPETVMKAVETSAKGYVLFSRIREGKVITYGLRP